MNRLIMILAGVLLCALFLSFGSSFTTEEVTGAGVNREPLIQTLVKWQPWAEGTLAQAEHEDKLIYLDISPFWCSQCSQMDRDAYNDDSISLYINKNFIPVRVDPDREPDVGERYHLSGFPSCVILTPDGQAVGGGTYLPNDSLVKLLRNVEGYWINNPAFVRRQAQFVTSRFVHGVDSLMIGTPSDIVLGKAGRAVQQQYDSVYGGFGTQPKFPLPEVTEFMLNAVNQQGTPIYAMQLTKTLNTQLGLLDTIWGGFYRYAHFDNWERPSYEKLLSVNAALLDNYLDAHQATGSEHYRQVADSVIEYLDRFLKSGEGWGFYNSQCGEIPYPEHYVSGEEYYSKDSLQRLALGIPPVDSSIYTDANAMTISAYLKAAKVAGRSDCRDYAVRTLDEVLEAGAEDNGTLYHDLLNNNAAPDGLLTDEVNVATALLDAYEITGNEPYLKKSRKIVDFVEANLVDPWTGGLNMDRSEAGEPGRLSIAVKPVGLNCLAVILYIRLYHITADENYYENAGRILNYALRAPLAKDDLRLCQLANCWLWMTRYPVKFVMVGPRGAEYDSLVASTWTTYYPRSVMIHLTAGKNGLKLGDLTFPESDKPLLFVCDATQCSQPIDDPHQAAEMIRAFLKPSS
jgi:uncharacterized protein YyaL (SSP411 family)